MDPLVTSSSPPDFEACKEAQMPLHEVLSQIAGKWTILVVGALSQGPRRFGELRRSLDGISQKMLTSTLRDLERDGFVTRTVTPSIPPRVDYELTQMGLELNVPLRVIGAWAHVNRARIEAARERFAQRAEEARQLAW